MKNEQAKVMVQVINVDGSKSWFDAYGLLSKKIPDQCLNTLNGWDTESAKKWVADLGFCYTHAIKESFISYVRSHRLNADMDMSDDELNRKLLFVYCKDFRDSRV